MLQTGGCHFAKWYCPSAETARPLSWTELNLRIITVIHSEGKLIYSAFKKIVINRIPASKRGIERRRCCDDV